jgi:F-type H+-transporting ATPase subunit alpha
MHVEEQVLIIWVVSNGFGDNIAVEDLSRMEAEFLEFVRNSHPAVLNAIRDKKTIDDDVKALMTEAIDDFKATRWESYKAETAKA